MSVAKIPNLIKNNIDNYVQHGYPPGGFCEAVLRNDLTEAVQRADLACRRALPDIVEYVKLTVPAEAKGSEDAIIGWAAVIRKRKTDPRND